MRSMISVLVLALVLGSVTPAFARHGRWGFGRGFGGGFSRGYYGGGYRNSYYGYGNPYSGPTIMVVSGGRYYAQPYQSSYAPTTIQTFGGGRGMALSPATGFVGNGGPFVIVR